MFSANNYTITYDNNYYTDNLWSNTSNLDNYSNWSTGVTSKTSTGDVSVIGGQVLNFVMGSGTQGGVYYKSLPKLTIGKQYTWSVYIRTSSNRTLYVGDEQGGRKVVDATGQWQKITHTFIATDITHEFSPFVFYVIDGSSWIEGDELYIHSLELMEGTPTHTTQTKTYGNTLGTLPTPTRTGYTLSGWYTAPTGDTKISSATAVPASNTTYYAHWTLLTPPSVVVRATSTTGTQKGTVASGGNSTIYSGVADNYLVLSGSAGGKYAYSTSANGTYTELSGNSLKVTATTSGVTYYLKSKDTTGSISSTYTTVTVKLVKMDTITSTRSYIGVTGDTKTATVSVTGSNLGTVTYSSGNTSIATVNSSGVVTAKSAGSVVITVKAGTDSTVYKQITINVTSLTSPSNSSQTVLEDASITLTAPTASSNAGTITYTSSNTAYATVTNARVVKGIDIGTAVSRTVTITAKEANGGATCTYTITVRVWATGSGTSSAPYLITNVRDITKLRSKVNSSTASGYRYSNTFFQQTANIALSAWTPIGYPNDTHAFSGTYNGNGKTVSGISISGKNNNAGLFGNLKNGNVKNLTVSGSVSGGRAVGGIVGYMINGEITNCVNKITLTGQNAVGGIAGSNWKGTISQCSNTAAINAKDMDITNGEWYANEVQAIGGIVGEHIGTVTQCYNKGNITITKNDTSHDVYQCVGGIVGFLGQPSSSTPGTISHSYNTGKISGYGRYFGGICGDAYVGTIDKTYNIGSVTTTKTSDQCIGSIVGPYNNQATITSSYWLSGTTSAGYGVLWNTPAPSTSGIIKKTSTELKALTSTLGTTYWKNDTGNVNSGYPILKWQ